MPEDNPKPHVSAPLEVEQALQLELMQKRAAWKHAKARGAKVRAMSFLFLFLVIMGAVVGYLFLNSERPGVQTPAGVAPAPATISPSPSPG